MELLMPAKRLKIALGCLQLAVSLASAALSGFCGWLAADALYPHSNYGAGQGVFLYADGISTAGIISGAVAGLGAGFLWSWALRRSTLNSIKQTGLMSSGVVGRGLGLGLVAGIAATIFLHLTLTILTGDWSEFGWHIIWGLLFGIPAGLALGLFCGFLWWGVCLVASHKLMDEQARAALGND
jgi:hypothetical protein